MKFGTNITDLARTKSTEKESLKQHSLPKTMEEEIVNSKDMMKKSRTRSLLCRISGNSDYATAEWEQMKNVEESEDKEPSPQHKWNGRRQ